MQYDAIIVGGSYAGLAAGLQLARARRRILVVDAGQRRNRFSEHSHGFLTQDGSSAAAIVAKGREQLLAYDTVSWIDGKVSGVTTTDGNFTVHIQGRQAQQARRLVLALGVVDVLPPLPGLAERWGRHVFHCPYCHGYELNQGRIGVLATSGHSMHQALMLPDWGDTTLFLNDVFEPDEKQLAQLASRGVKLERGLVERIDGQVDMVMKDGRVMPLDGLFVATRVEVTSPLVAELGCQIEEGPMGRTIRTDERQKTTVPGVFACGDAARQGGSVPFSVAAGAMAGSAAHLSLFFDGV